jgi:5-methylcytosine-specific restriction endonuclease McrA
LIREAPRTRILLGYDRNGIPIYTRLKNNYKGINLDKRRKTLDFVSKKQRIKNLSWKEVEAFCLKRANFTCEAKFEGCQKSLYLQGHHKIFRSKGGKNTIENCLIVCSNCHAVLHRLIRRN